MVDYDERSRYNLIALLNELISDIPLVSVGREFHSLAPLTENEFSK